MANDPTAPEPCPACDGVGRHQAGCVVVGVMREQAVDDGMLNELLDLLAADDPRLGRYARRTIRRLAEEKAIPPGSRHLLAALHWTYCGKHKRRSPRRARRARR